MRQRAFDRQAEAWLDTRQKPDDGVSPEEAQAKPEDDALEVSCMRCYSLTHYGKVKSQMAEGQLPEFDLGKKVGRKIALQKDRR